MDYTALQLLDHKNDSSCTQKRPHHPKGNESDHNICVYRRDRGLRSRSVSPGAVRRKKLIFRHICHVSVKVSTFTTATACACIFSLYDPLWSQQSAEWQAVKNLHTEDNDMASDRRSQILTYSSHSALTETRHIATLALARVHGISTLKRKAARTNRLYFEHPPPVLFLASSIVFALAISAQLHLQQVNRYRHHFLGVGILVGIVVGVIETKEDFLLHAKGYIAGYTILALLLSSFVHGFWRLCRPSENEACTCGRRHEDECAKGKEKNLMS
ncbi:hypothetical protein BKA64DRAFT_3548 [Cadophora sp. MPI-SDFR-AT-0126]|nr:hypothetical protein BKA64DRAFT_3548 [Leotiomycetes sp. MPI-SDFR-AT-0126]